MNIDLITAAIPAAPPRNTAGAPFKEGDVLKARVAQLMGEGRLLLELENGKTLKAVVVPEMDLAAGERLVLQVCGQAQGKTNMQVLLRDGGAETTAVRGTPHAAQDTGAAISPSVQPADAGAIEALCRLVAEAPKIGEALNTALAKLQTEAGETTAGGVNSQPVNTGTPGQAQAAQAAPGAGQPDAAAGTPAQQAPATATPPLAGAGSQPVNTATPENAQAPQAAPGTGQPPDAAGSAPNPQAPATATPPPAGAGSRPVKPAAPEDAQAPQEIAPGAEGYGGKAEAGAQKDESFAYTEGFTRADPGETLMREIRDLFVRPDAPDFGGESLKRRVEALSERLEELAQKAGFAGLRDAAGNLAAQDRLASQVQQFTYLQIPVMLRERGTTAELYVFRRNGKGKPVDPGATVVMLVLDTEHMGRVETVVRAEDKNVQLKMRVRDRRVAQMLEEKAALMDRALEETGFRLTQMSCRVADAPVTPECAQRVALDLLRDGGPHLDIVI